MEDSRFDKYKQRMALAMPLLLYGLIQLIYHILMSEPESSDAMWFFRKQLAAFTLPEYLKIRYHTWSSRLVIEAVLVYVSRNVFLWKVLDWFVWMFLAWAIMELFPDEQKQKAGYLVAGALLLYPIWDLKTAGWIATTINYSWALAFGVFALHGVSRVFYGKKVPVWLGVLYCIAAVYGANMEQMSAVMLAVCTLAIVVFVIQKRKVQTYWQVIACDLIAAGEFVFIMTCPGNSVRKLQEIGNCMPQFVSYNLIDKASLGFMGTMKHLLTSGNMIFLCYLVILMVLVWWKTDSSWIRATAVFPAVVTVLLTFFGSAVKQNYPTFYALLTKNQFITGANYHKPCNYVPLLLQLLIVGCIMIAMIAVCDSFSDLFVQLYFLALALATRVIMGFTPTIYVSKERTFFFLYMMLLVHGIWLLLRNEELLKEHKTCRNVGKVMGLCLVIFNIVMSVVEIGSR